MIAPKFPPREHLQDVEALDNAALGRSHLRVVVAAGVGFFTDAYDLFVIGAVLTLLKSVWHLSTSQVGLVSSVALGAAFLGALVFGRLADVIGRRKVFIIVAAIMIVGSVSSAFAPSVGWLVVSRALLGLGIGGDYPVSAVLTSEFSNRADRGRLVGLVFSMQALGLVVGPLVGVALVGGGVAHDLAWRIMLGVGAIPALAVVWMRLRMPESPRFEAHRKAVQRQLPGFEEAEPPLPGAAAVATAEVGSRKLGLVAFLTNRKWLVTLLGTAGTWFLFDYAYYGNSISTPAIIKDIAPHASLAVTLALTLVLFAVAAAPGYVVAFLTMDRIGHRRLQVIGFAIMGVCFLLLGVFHVLTTVVGTFLLVYGVSYFFAEFGPNTTTFVMSAEVFPVNMRTTGHGISAGVAKFGAFIGVYLFPILNKHFGLRGSMLIAAAASLGGMALSFVLPEPAGQSLQEIDEEIPQPAPVFKVA